MSNDNGSDSHSSSPYASLSYEQVLIEYRSARERLASSKTYENALAVQALKREVKSRLSCAVVSDTVNTTKEAT